MKVPTRIGDAPMLKLTRWTIAHRRIVVVAWIVLAVGVLGISQVVGKRNANNFSLPNTDSQRAVDLLQNPLRVGRIGGEQRLHDDLLLFQIGLQVDQLDAVLLDDVVHAFLLVGGEVERLDDVGLAPP